MIVATKDQKMRNLQDNIKKTDVKIRGLKLNVQV